MLAGSCSLHSLWETIFLRLLPVSGGPRLSLAFDSLSPLSAGFPTAVFTLRVSASSHGPFVRKPAIVD